MVLFMVQNTECSKLVFQIPPERIVFLKFILEGYDGLAVLSTLDAKSGIVVLGFPPENKEDLMALLESFGIEAHPEITSQWHHI